MLLRVRIILAVIFSVCSISAFAQLDGNTTLYSPLQEEVIEYDVNTGTYLFYKLEGGRKLFPYKVLTREQYSEYQKQNAIREAWLGQRTGSNAHMNVNTSLIPTLRVENEFFGNIFGGREITITPQGSAEVLFGFNNTYVDNPMIPKDYRSSSNFDLNTRLQFNIDGKIGERLRLRFNYNTEATFDFEQEIKLEYIGGEDDIIQKIEAGNVSFPLAGTLITGSQSLWGIKTDLKFGKLLVSSLISQQRAESRAFVVAGGAQTNNFDIRIDRYSVNRHFFLTHTFRDNYENALRNPPLVLSGITITKIEVWVTNRSSRFEDSRNVVAFIDLAEPTRLLDTYLRNTPPPAIASDGANRLFTVVDRGNIRDISKVTSYLSTIVGSTGPYTGGSNFEKLENARKLEQGRDYVLNDRLGYISLTNPLNYDEVLAVAFEYTAADGKTYKVGELSTDGIISPEALVVKMLKGTNPTPLLPTWDLMMKNIYDLNVFQLSPKNFILDIYHQDEESGNDMPFITEGNIKNVPLIRVLNLDNLNSQQDPFPDGIFDFIEGVTVQSSKGLIIFPVLEPFGSSLKRKIGDPAIAERYIFQELYDSTLTRAREFAEKNRFRLVGSYQSEVSSEISLNAVNIPEGSVVVTAGSTRLTEGVDYIVNYTMGTVRIINPSFAESGIPISVTLEDRGLFNVMQKTMYGTHWEYRFNEKLNIGATLLGIHERPLTHKVLIGEDPVSNLMWGLNASYQSESKMLTRLVNKLPFITTKTPSQVNFDAEFAQLLPNQARAAGGFSYIDDFEALQTSVDLRSYLSWHLASTPQGLFAEATKSNDLSYGYRRSKLAWYTISPDFLRNTAYTPGYIKANPSKFLDNHFVREIPINEIFVNRDIVIGQPNVLSTLNLAYYPNTRGPYNYQTSIAKIASDGTFSNPAEQWGGIMRSLTETDFEAANFEYIEFWMMDPFVYNVNGKGGDLYINLGNISEDVLKDGYKQFENGLPFPFDADKVIETAWGRVPRQQSLVYTFDNNYAARPYQDVGFDGLRDEDERDKFTSYLNDLSGYLTSDAYGKIYQDPSSDNYKYFFDPSFAEIQASILDCYIDFNGTDGNSRPSEQTQGQNTMSTPYPDVEDLNRDNTMNEVESFFQYRIRLSPQSMVVGQNFITDIIKGEANFKEGEREVKWYQFKVPISGYEKKVGDIYDFKSIRFMRMFLTNFTDTTFIRFATLNLVRSEWRRFDYSLIEGQEGLAQPEFANAQFDISVVNIEENSTSQPVNYVMPPSVSREIDPGTYQQNLLNEQSMQLTVVGLDDGEARAAFKNIMYDFRQFRRLQMYVHAHAITGYPLKDGDVSLFVRIGSDFRNNYYEYEIPLKITPPGLYNDYQRDIVWPEENFMDLDLQLLTDLKLERNQVIKYTGGTVRAVYEKVVGDRKYRVMGNPNLGGVRTIMIGIRNPSKVVYSVDDGASKSGVVWVNELRLSNVINDGGWALNARLASTFADFGAASISGNIKTAGFGSLESRINERLQQDIYQYDIVTNFEMGKFFPEKLGVRIPMFFGFSEYYELPLFNPYDSDIRLRNALNSLPSGSERDSLRTLVQTHNRRKAFSINNMRIAPGGGRQRVFDVSNVALNYSYNESVMRNAQILRNIQKNYSGALAYTYNVQPKYIEPFSKIRSSSLGLISGFNINPYPNQFNFITEINRHYGEQQSRNVVYPDIIIPPTFAKDFTWTRNYAIIYDIARSLKLEFIAVNTARIDEPEGLVDRGRDPEGYRHWRDSIWTNIGKFGRNVSYNQQAIATWQLPTNRVPILNWINAHTAYNAGFEWVAAPMIAEGVDYNPGNTISNQQTLFTGVSLSFNRLYAKSTFLRNINNKFSGATKPNYGFREVSYQSSKANYTASRKRTIRHGLGTTDVVIKLYDEENREVRAITTVQDKNNVTVEFSEDRKNITASIVGQVPKSQNPLEFAGELLLRLGMSLQMAQIDYTEQNTSVLPGFNPGSSFFGQSNYNGQRAPGWGFVFGRQDFNFVDRARSRGWLTEDPNFISPYMMTRNRDFRIQTNLLPVTDLQIRLVGMRTIGTTEATYNIVNPLGEHHQTGRFTISVISIGSAFENPSAKNDFRSASYDKFLSSRRDVAWLYASRRLQNASSEPYDPGTGEFPNGYGEFSQQVLIGSFLAAYTGRSINSGLFDNFPTIPMPNWDINYIGLPRIPLLKPIFRSATIRHVYVASYSISSFSLNRLYNPQEDGFSYIRNTLNDFIPQHDIVNVSLREEMSPLIQFDLGLQNNMLLNFEIRRARIVSLSLSNNQITENRNREYLVGGGYLFNNVPLLFNFEGRAGATTRTQLSVRADFSYREETNIIRRLDQDADYSQISDGRDVVSIKFHADYTISNRVNMRLFFDRMLTNPYVSSIGTTNTSVGLSVRVLFTP